MNDSKFYKTKWFRKIVIFLFVVSCLYFLGQRFWVYREEIKYAIENIQSQYLWMSLLLLIASFVLRPMGFHIFLRVNMNPVSFLENFRTMYISQLAKYLPGGVWVYPSRVIVYKESGVDVGTSSLGLVFESITLVLSSMLSGSFLFFLGSKPMPWFSGVQLVVLTAGCTGSIVFLLFPQVLDRLFPKLYRKVPYLHEFNRLGFKSRLWALVSTVVVFVLMWCFAGSSFYYLIKGLDPGVVIGVLPSIGIFSISWLVGFISIFNPGGVGIRETAIVLLLGVYTLEPIPLLVAITSRIFWSFLELLFFLIAWLLKSRVQVQ